MGSSRSHRTKYGVRGGAHSKLANQGSRTAATYDRCLGRVRAEFCCETRFAEIASAKLFLGLVQALLSTTSIAPSHTGWAGIKWSSKYRRRYPRTCSLFRTLLAKSLCQHLLYARQSRPVLYPYVPLQTTLSILRMRATRTASGR